MPITLQCRNGHRLRVKDSAAGKKVRCPTCEDVIVVGKNLEVESQSKGVDSAEDDPKQKRLRSSANLPIRSGTPARGTTRDAQKRSRIIAPVIGAIVTLGGIGVVVLFLTRKTATDPKRDPSPPEISRTVAADVTQPVTAASNPANQNPLPAAPSSESNSTIAKKTSLKASTAAIKANAEAEKKPEFKARDSAEHARPSSQLPATVAVAPTGLLVWDTSTAAPTANRDHNLVGRGESWISVGPGEIAAHEFLGDCVVTNEKLWLHIPRDSAEPIQIAAKEANSSEAVIPINILGARPSAEGPRISRVTELSGDSALVTFGVENRGPKVACRISKGKYWIEVIPLTGAEQLTIGIKAKFVVLPTEFGEDQICDADDAIRKNISSAPLPHENMVIALEQEGNHMCIVTYPSIRQAGELTLGFRDSEGGTNRGSDAIATSLSAKLGRNSVYVCLLPQKNLWYSQVVTKKYSAPGHIPITDKSLYPGIWRIAGRVTGRHGPAFYVSEFPDTNLLFECRQSGTCECLFYFLSRPLAGPGDGVLTPLDIYRETVGQNKSSAYLLETETAGRLYHRATKYRGVCGCMDDMIDKWKLSPQTITEDPDYFSKLFADCKVIMEHMDIRLHEYQRMGQHLKEVLEKTKVMSTGDSAAQEFLAAARRCSAGLTIAKLVDANRGYRMLDNMEMKIRAASKTKLNLVALEKQMERARDVAGDEEIQLKKFRGLVMTLSTAAMRHREKSSEPLKETVTIIGRECRKLLRTRGRAE